MTVKVTDAYVQSGWTNHDHLIDRDRVKRVIGRTFRSYPAALRAADRLAGNAYAAVTYIDLDTGERWLRARLSE